MTLSESEEELFRLFCTLSAHPLVKDAHLKDREVVVRLHGGYCVRIAGESQRDAVELALAGLAAS